MFEAFKRYRLRIKRQHCYNTLMQTPERLVGLCQFLEDFQKLRMDKISDHFLMTRKLPSSFRSAGHCLEALTIARQVIASEQRLPPELSFHRAKTQLYLEEWLAGLTLPAFHQQLVDKSLLIVRQLLSSRARGDQLYPYYQRNLKGYFLEVLELSQILMEAK